MANFVYSRRRLKLGSAFRVVIHAGVDLVPDALLSKRKKERIKNCVRCGRRVQALDRYSSGEP